MKASASIAAKRERAMFLRFCSRLRDASDAVFHQLGHREREATYQRALSAELSAHYTCELEYPVPVRYVTADGRVVTLGHERADIVVSERGAPSGESIWIVEVKRSTFNTTTTVLRDALDQARRYAGHVGRTTPVGGVCAVLFDKTGRSKPCVQNQPCEPN